MTLDRTIRLGFLVLLGLTLTAAGCKDDGPYTIKGSARLPDCMEAPAYDLDDTEWFDTGVITIESTGCGTAQPDDMFDVCALNWVMTQEGGDIRIIVDNEYRILGRLCGTSLYLEGGWWLPVEDEGFCTYSEDSAEEVGIEAGGNVLIVSEQPGGGMLLQAEGDLSVAGSCDAEYEVTLFQLR